MCVYIYIHTYICIYIIFHGNVTNIGKLFGISKQGTNSFGAVKIYIFCQGEKAKGSHADIQRLEMEGKGVLSSLRSASLSEAQPPLPTNLHIWI